MRLNTADRSFMALVAIALVPYLVLGFFACGVLSVTGMRLVTEGWSVVARDQELRAALPLLLVVGMGTLLATGSLVTQLVATWRLASAVSASRVAIDERVASAADRGGVSRVDVADSDDPYSFTYGLLRPRIVVSRGLIEATTDAELDAVLAHERYHVRNLDTLKVVLARALSAAFFFLPALRHLQARYLAARELAADRAAVRTGGRSPLAGALYKVVGGPARVNLGAAAALGNSDLLDMRLTQLERQEEPALAAVPRTAVATTAAGLLLIGAAGILAAATLRGSTMGMSGPGVAQMDAVGLLLCAVGWTVAVGTVVGRFAARRG